MAEPEPSQQQQQQQRGLAEIPPPQIGTSLPFIWPPPEHLQTPPPFEEPTLPFPPPESLLTRETKLDALRCEEPSKYQGLQVYDSLNKPSRADYPDARGPTRGDDMARWYVPTGPDDDTVVFESRFESGNLRSAEKIDTSEYNLQLAFDINTDRHTQWFYFRLSNLRRDRLYKLNMQNLMKTEAVYNLGMQPLAYSQARAQHEDVGWYRTGSDVCYFKNQQTRAGLKPFWTLTFVVQTKYDQDTLYLAHCFPYRYTDLQRYLNDLEVSPLGLSGAIRRRRLCETLAGNACDLLTITSPGGDHASKKGIVISARVHPGETNASWMMKGVLDYLSSDCHSAVALREKFVFKIVPILNPDGVIVGNYRCSLAGGDLNRQYEEPKRELFPEVLHLKQMISNFGIGKEVLLFVDLHGHSKKSNIFMYGVENPTDETLYMRERVIPNLLHEASPLFNLPDCTFDIGKGKEGCGRVVVRRQLGIVNAYTMEASFMGADQGEFQGIHFHQGHYESMGHSLCEVLLHLVDPDQTKVEGIVRTLKDKFPIDQSRVVLKRDDRGDTSSGASSSSEDSNSSWPGRRLHGKAPSKPSTPTPRGAGASKSRPASAAGKPASAQEGRTTGAVDGSFGSGGGPSGKDGKQHTISVKKSKSNGSTEHPKPAAKATPSKPTTPMHTVSKHSSAGASLPQKPSATKPYFPKSAAKAAAIFLAAAKASSSKSGGSKSRTPRAANAGSGETSGGGRVKAAHSAVRGGAAETGTGTTGAPQLKAKPTSKASAGGAGAKTAVRTVTAKPASAGGESSSRGGGGGARDSKVAAVPPVAITRGDSKKFSKRSVSSAGVMVKAKGVPPVGPSGSSARRPKSSPASRSMSSPRRRASPTADAPKRSPSAPLRRTETSSGASAGGGKVVGGESGGASKGKKGGTKKEVLPPPLRSKPAASAKLAARRES
ncbi:unnamed protein product [Pylaiella littoralis]